MGDTIEEFMQNLLDAVDDLSEELQNNIRQSLSEIENKLEYENE